TTLGGVQAFTSLTMVFGPLLAGMLFDLIGPSAPYLSGAGLLVSALAVLLTTLRNRLLKLPQPVTTNATAEVAMHTD
ncbi:MAG: MFS transporter, partial [Chloroflexus sp.]